MEKQIELMKPKLRGFIHLLAFICTLVTSFVFAITFLFKQTDIGILIYLFSQLLQFGISSSYHIVSWTPKIKRLFRRLDHICIFILISGTQTSIVLSTPQVRKEPAAVSMISISWLISLLGIMKIIIMRNLHDIFDLAVYIGHGAIILPFYHLFVKFEIIDKICILLGGILYIIGGLIYGFEAPNPSPKFFGYHEIFHVFTVLANLCFGLVITRKYILEFLGIY